MRAISTLLCFLFLSSFLWAQPNNDDCGDATELNLSTPPGCPSTTPVMNNFMASNIDATAISPYPVFSGCASGSTSGPAAEVWFSFEATANQTTVQVNGLSNPNVVLYQGDNCVSLLALDCNSGFGTTSVIANTLVGLTYYLLVSGADINDQGNFSMTITSKNLCNSCAPPGAIDIVPSPPPINGTFSSGQTVQFCATVNIWEGNAAGTIEWLHSVTFELGDGWNENSIVPLPPPSCGNDGSWGWYDSWTGCNTNQTFGPGFAYDSSNGIGCGGSPNDGDPGNNWGDGLNNCFDIPAAGYPSFEFCFNIDVDDCPPGDTGDDLGISVAVWSDGDSGSWTQTGCNSGQELEIVSSIICCNDDEPLVTVFDTSCGGLADGYMEIEGNGGFDANEVFNFYVFNDIGSIVYECISCSGTVITDANLPAGSYSVTAINVGNDCPRSAGPFDLNEPDEPQASAIALNLPCPGGTAMLEGSVDLGGGTEIYTWEGPDGTIYNGQTVEVPDVGTYTLTVLVDGCPSSETTVDVDFVDFSVFIIGDDEACFDADFELEASDGVSWEWVDLSNNALLGTSQVLTTSLTNSTTIELTATDINGCTATDEIDININDLPDISIEVIGLGCSNELVIVTADGAGPNATYEWLDSPGEPNPRELNNYAPGFYDLEVLATDENGCETIFIREVQINPPPEVTLEVSENPVCAGETVTVTAISNDPISSIDWNGAGPNNQNPITIQVDGFTEIIADVTNTDGCTTSDVLIQINAEQAPPPPTISCGTSTSTSVEFVWTDVPGADEYEITINNGFGIPVFGTSYTATGFVPNTMVTITVQALGPDLCPVELATFTCSTEACAPIDLEIDAVAPICLLSNTPNFNLDFTTDSPGGTVVWSGMGIQNPTTGEFSPGMAMAGMHDITLEYTLGTCTYSDMITIEINDTPTSNFTISNSGPICTNSEITVMYDDVPSAGATYNWNFDGGAATPGTGAGPHTVSWATPGSKTITLSVSENGCTSSISSQTVTVVAPIATPVVSCGTATTSSVVFNWAAVTGANSYTITTIAGPDNGTLAGTSYTVNGLMPGETVTITVTANTSNVCGPTTSTQVSCSAADCPIFTIDITAIPDICLDGSNPAITLQATASGGAGGGTFNWSGPEVMGDQFNPAGPGAGAGMHTIMVTYTEGNCSETATIVVTVFDTPTSDFILSPASVCTGQDATINYTGTASAGATYVWNFNGGVATPGTGPGPHTISWPTGGSKTVTLTVSENGCMGSTVSQSISVEEPMATPIINCAPNTTSIVFSWSAVSGATGYQVNVINAPPGAMTALDETARTFTVTGLVALETVEIEVIALGNGPCGNSSATFSCQAQDCPDITVTIDDVAPLCLLPTSPDIMLTTVLVGGDGDGTYTWSGDGIADMNVGLFSPTDAGVGSAVVSVTYTEDGCTFTDNLSIQINAIPTADFTLASPVCVNAESIATYDGSAGAMATYNWNFGTGTASPGTGVGPHNISWSTAGIKTVTLTVTENNCTSEIFTQMVTVDQELVVPTILCDVSGDSITFNWPAVVGASGYNVTIIDAPANASPTGNDPDRSFTISGLIPGQMVTIEVEAISATACPNISFQGTCSLQDCPDITLTIDDVTAICLDGNATAFNLSAVLTGNTAGVLSWSGTGITDTAAATFDPTVSGDGSFVITATYTEMTCVYADDIMIVVNAQPDASFTATSPICEDGTSTITYTGGADPAAAYNWDFDNGTIISGSNEGPYEISWPDAGTATVSLSVTENNCASEPFTAMVSILDSLIAPDILCDSDNTSITFSWNDIAGATGYTVTVIDAPAGAVESPDIDNRTYGFTNLIPGDMVTIQVDVLTDQVCGGVSNTQTCTALSCDDRFFGTDGYGPFCADVGTQTFSPVISGGILTGTISWSGTGITDQTMGTFDPAIAMIGSNLVTLAYEENGCFYDTTYTVVVNAIPIAAFTLDDPICATATSTITFTGTAGPTATYDWDFGTGTIISGSDAGPYEIQWATAGQQTVSLTVTENDCVSEAVSENLQVEAPLIAPVISCDNDNTSITFSWNDVIDATGYTVTVISAPVGAMEMEDIANRTYSFTNLTPGDEVIIQVDVLTNNICGGVSNTQTCMALSCDDRFFGTDGYGPFCADVDTQTFSPVISGGALTGTISWSGTGITDQTMGTFDPATAMIGSNLVTLAYEENGCFYDTTYTVIVNAIPVAAFTLDDPICATATSTITFTGTAGPTATYDWDFGTGTIISGSDSGPYEVQWATAGQQTVSLTVTENDCVSEAVSENLQVEAPLIAPVISCDNDNTSITFSWNDVIDATGYTVTVISAPAGAMEMEDIANRTYSFTNLMPGDEVIIQVDVLTDNICGGVSIPQTCMAQTCDPRAFGTDGYGPFCADAGAQTLTPVLSGGALTGAITWGGDGITDPVAGTFDPATATIGENMVSLAYEENGCLYDTIYTIVVNAVPEAAFTVDSPICLTSTSTVSFTGTAGATATYDWDFGDGNIVSGTDAGPYEIEWSNPGTQSISLSITEEGCTSNTFSEIVEVQDTIAPVVITCLPGTTSSVNFSWAPVAGADTYTVAVLNGGPTGIQTGNTYSITGLNSGQEITIEVTASGSTICGSSVATGSCEAVECQNLTASLTGSDVICAGESASLVLNYDGGQGNSFTVDYTVNGEAFQLTGVLGPTTITLDNITATTTVVITQLADEANANCVYPSTAEWTVMVDQPVNAGTDTTLAAFCADNASVIDLNAALTDADAGGIWTETSSSTSTGGAFNAAAGTFNAIGQAVGVYSFTYTVNGGACPEASANVSLTILPEPVADAGPTQVLTCNMGMVTIGGNSSSTPGTTYAWTVDNPDAMISDPTASMIDVSAAGTYTLTVTNAEGCTDTDQVVVDAELDVPVGDISISEVSCFQENDGAIVINEVTGGTPPYLYTLNDGEPTTNTFFGQLGGAEYTLTITDANGCFTELSIMLLEPTEVAVELIATTLEGEDGTLINLGESVTLTALYDPSIQVDTIIWQPDSIAIGNQQAVEVSPSQTSTYTVTVMDINGCADTDMMTVFVRKDRPIFVPSAFAPTGSGENQILLPFGGNDVKEIKSFLVFNRWGETVFENYNFQPNDPTQGWDGRHRGQMMNAAVFVYYLEVEYTDGEVILFKGDVMLLR